MTPEAKDKIAKVYELVVRGEAGEKEAAKRALDKLMKKYNLDDDDITTITIGQYPFKYSNNIEMWLLHCLTDYFLGGKEIKAYRSTIGVRQVVLYLDYMDFITISTSYEYFKRHMMAQYKKLVLPQVNRCRIAKNKNAKRFELQKLFFERYVIASKLYKPGDVVSIDLDELSEKELKQRRSLRDVEGGQYHSQVNTGLYLEA